MKKWFLSLLAVPALLVGCNDEEINEEDTMTPVEVTITTPLQLNVGEEIELAAEVKQGDAFVDDAEEVKFEVWESGMRDEGTMVEGTLTSDGTYVASYTFDHDGIYYMFAHTTARGMHVMPKVELTVGAPDMSKVMPDDSSDSMEGMNGHGMDSEESEDEESHGHE